MRRSTKLFILSAFAVVALNGALITKAFATESTVPVLEPGGGKADCYSTYSATGTTVFFQCMSCLEKTGSPSGDSRTCP